MSNFYAELGQMQNISTQLQEISSSLSEICNSVETTSHDVSETLSVSIPILKTLPGNVRKQASAVQKLGTGLSEIAALYREHENTIVNNVRGEGTAAGTILERMKEVLENQAESSSQNNSQADPEDMSYEDYLEYRCKNAIDENTRKIYEKYCKKIKINDDDYDGTAHYNPLWNHINYDAQADSTNERGVGYTYYHEIGHLIDDRSDWNGNTSSDWSYDFYDKLQKDIDNWIDRNMKENGYTSKDDAYDDLSDWLWEDEDLKNGLSDLVIGLTDGKASGKWGHDQSYYDSKSIASEAFAHFFESGMRADSTKLDYVKELFPTAYAEFQQMLIDELD